VLTAIDSEFQNLDRRPHFSECTGASKALIRHWFQATLYPETGDLVARNGDRFWQQDRLFPETKSPFSGDKVACFGNKCGQALNGVIYADQAFDTLIQGNNRKSCK